MHFHHHHLNQNNRHLSRLLRKKSQETLQKENIFHQDKRNFLMPIKKRKASKVKHINVRRTPLSLQQMFSLDSLNCTMVNSSITLKISSNSQVIHTQRTRLHKIREVLHRKEKLTQKRRDSHQLLRLR